jgi:hypothetical protein
MMNTRLQELAIKAGRTGLPYGEIEIQKFAELIIRECAEISNQAEQQCQHPATQILKHFGVEQ